MKPVLAVLAAGMGSRYGGLKQIDPVGPSGEIIIDYSIYDAMRAGFEKVVFIIRKAIENDFKERVSSRFEGKIEVDYAFQELDALPAPFISPSGRTKPWGTAHAILSAEKQVGETPFAVINSDDYYGRAGYRMLFERLSSVKDANFAEYCMVGFVLRNTLSEHGHVSRGVCQRDTEDYLTDIVERTKIVKDGDGAKFTDESGAETRLSGNETVSMNMWGFTPSIFGYLNTLFKDFLSRDASDPKSEFFIPSAISRLVSQKKARVKIMTSPDPWFGITYKEDKPAVMEKIRELVAKGVYPAKLF